jgi:hypothetical protein
MAASIGLHRQPSAPRPVPAQNAVLRFAGGIFRSAGDEHPGTALARSTSGWAKLPIEKIRRHGRDFGNRLCPASRPGQRPVRRSSILSSGGRAQGVGKRRNSRGFCSICRKGEGPDAEVTKARYLSTGTPARLGIFLCPNPSIDIGAIVYVIFCGTRPELFDQSERPQSRSCPTYRKVLLSS